MKYKSERIVNLGELEAIHKSLFSDASRLREEFEKEEPDMVVVEEFAKQIHMNAHKADDFEFYIEQRIIHDADDDGQEHMKYQSERIENLGVLDSIHKSLFVDASNLRAELEKESPNMLYVDSLVKAIHMEAHRADDFEFCIEIRTVNENQSEQENPSNTDSYPMEHEAKFLVTEYCNGVTDISFRLPSHGWEKVEKSECWEQLCNLLGELQKEYILMYPTRRSGL